MIIQFKLFKVKDNNDENGIMETLVINDTLSETDTNVSKITTFLIRITEEFFDKKG